MGKTLHTKKIKIIGILTHFKLRTNSEGKEFCIIGGVDYARVIQPLSYLPKDRFEVDIQYEPVKKDGRFKTPEDLAKYYDICYFSYIESVPFYLQLKVMGLKHGMKMILDLDDNIWSVDPSHPSYQGFNPTSEETFKRSAIIVDVDGVTTTNRFLKYEINKNVRRPFDEVSVMPNFIDLTKYDYRKVKPLKKDEITIGYMGGSSHFPDVNKPEFTKALGIIMEKYPQVRFKTTFYMPSLKALFGYKYQYVLGRHNIYRFIEELWPQMMSESDIMVAPLNWSTYSRSKSWIKALEYGAGQKPVILEKIDPYEEFAGISPETKGVYLASTTDDWVKYLSTLIETGKLRKENGLKLYNYVKDNCTIQKNVNIYSDYFSKFDNRGRKL